YFLALAALLALAAALPGLGLMAGLLPWYLREIAMPSALACLLVVLRIDGRPFHVAALSLLAHAIEPREVLGHGAAASRDHWCPDRLLLRPDGSDAQIRELSYTGPGAVLLTVAHARHDLGGGPLARLARRPELLVRELPGRRLARPRLIELADGARLRLR